MTDATTDTPAQEKPTDVAFNMVVEVNHVDVPINSSSLTAVNKSGIHFELAKGTTVTVVLPVSSREPLQEPDGEDPVEPAANDPEVEAAAETDDPAPDDSDTDDIPEVATV